MNQNEPSAEVDDATGATEFDTKKPADPSAIVADATNSNDLSLAGVAGAHSNS